MWAPQQKDPKEQVVTQVRLTFWKIGVVCPSKNPQFRVIMQAMAQKRTKSASSNILSQLRQAKRELGGHSKRRSEPASGKRAEELMVETLDAFDDFQEYRASMIPELRKALEAGAVPKHILGLAKSYAAARLAHIVATETDPARALTAIKELLDRTEGKSIERKDVRHRLDQVDEREVDALLLSSLNELEDEGESE